MHKITRLVCMATFAVPLLARAQTKDIRSAGQTWMGYVNQTRLTGKWGVWVDAHLRTRENMVRHLSQSIARAGLTYYASETSWLTAGYAYVTDYPGDGHLSVSRPEHRGWQQVQWLTRYNHISSTQRLRLEERFRRTVLNDSTLDDGYRFNYRARYSLLFQLPLTKPTARGRGVSWIANDEVMVNFGRQVVYNYFDQNRFFTGVNIQVAPNNTLQAGYMNIFQQLPAGNKYRVAHVARVYYYHNVDLRRKEKERRSL